MGLCLRGCCALTDILGMGRLALASLWTVDLLRSSGGAAASLSCFSRSGDGILDHADPRARELCAKRNEERQKSAHGVYLQHGGRNFNAGKLHGNRDHVLVCGRAHEGCI